MEWLTGFPYQYIINQQFKPDLQKRYHAATDFSPETVKRKPAGYLKTE